MGVKKIFMKHIFAISLVEVLDKAKHNLYFPTWALTQAEEKKLDAFHRKQLKRVVGIRYPVKITNKALYKQCNERPLSLYVLENRWRLFGHILRRDREIPANKAMEGFFVPQWGQIQGKTNYYLASGLEQRPVPFRK